jgi:hypothetical protein
MGRRSGPQDESTVEGSLGGPALDQSHAPRDGHAACLHASVHSEPCAITVAVCLVALPSASYTLSRLAGPPVAAAELGSRGSLSPSLLAAP